MRKILAAALMTICMAANSAAAGNSRERVTIYGLGHSSCADWKANLDRPSYRALGEQWVVGFLSAMDWAGPDGMDVPKFSVLTVQPFLDDFCRNNPERNIMDAALGLLQELCGGTSLPQCLR
jgi:hypothetical protein